MGRGWWYKTLWETAPSEVEYFLGGKKVVLYDFDFETSDLEFEVSKSSIWKHTTLCDKGVFSIIVISQLRWPDWAKISTGLLFYAYYVEVHQVRKLVFDIIINSVQCR